MPEARLPRGPLWLLRLCVSAEAFEIVAGDLEEEYRRHVLPDRGRAAARRWLWRQVLISATLRKC